MHGALNDEDKVKDCQEGDNEDDDVSNDGDDRLTRMLNMEVT